MRARNTLSSGTPLPYPTPKEDLEPGAGCRPGACDTRVELATGEELEMKLLDAVHVDSVVTSLTGKSFMAEKKILKESAKKEVDASFKKFSARSKVALRGGLYSAYTTQSLIGDFKSLSQAVQEEVNWLPLAKTTKHQIELLTDIPYAILRSTALE
ncbi:hypothetical protein NDU88_003734 [Pleurodeles waltl]|uniref:Uncharacterized protein n=1 Tax=Pleurodeles waltl TaxID=8319 RepID=A0AAV7LJE7_PLEWA|nr:hypothetical protein NDU88_003734 [Pleurodeles waltl]